MSDKLKLYDAELPPHVLAAAKEAGLKASPAYDEFVNAIVSAAFKSQYAVEFKSPERLEWITFNWPDVQEVIAVIAPQIGSKHIYDKSHPVRQQHLRAAAQAVLLDFRQRQVTQDESKKVKAVPASHQPTGSVQDDEQATIYWPNEVSLRRVMSEELARFPAFKELRVEVRGLMIRYCTNAFLTYLRQREVPQNESEKRISDSAKAKGGQSDFASVPLSQLSMWRDEWLSENDTMDNTDCVTPFDEYFYNRVVPNPKEELQVALERYHERTGNKVAVVHMGGVVKGIPKIFSDGGFTGSKNANAARMSVESVRPSEAFKCFTEIFAKTVKNLHEMMLVPDELLQTAPVHFFSLDKLQPATKAFFESLYPEAPLRAVQDAGSAVHLDYGRPGRSVKTLVLRVEGITDFPLWIQGEQS